MTNGSDFSATETSSLLAIVQPETQRLIGNRALTVIVVPPEDPEVVRQRDRVPVDFIGRRPMTLIQSPIIGSHDFSIDRRAPRFNSNYTNLHD